MSELTYWTPSSDRVIELYQQWEQGTGVLDLDWKCPGRKAPDPVIQEEDSIQEEEDEDTKEEISASNDFDFDDEEGVPSGLSTPQQRRAPGEAPRGSARKKTTSLDSVLSNMRRHKIIEEKEYKKEEK